MLKLKDTQKFGCEKEKIMKKFVISAIIILAALLISVFAVINSSNLTNGTAIIVEDNFILTFLAILASIVVLVATYLYSKAEEIRLALLNEKIEIDSCFKGIFKETRDDVIIVLSSLIVCYLIILFRDVDFPLLKYSLISKMQVISIIKLAAAILTFIATADVFIAVFNLMEIQRKINEGQL